METSEFAGCVCVQRALQWKVKAKQRRDGLEVESPGGSRGVGVRGEVLGGPALSWRASHHPEMELHRGNTGSAPKTLVFLKSSGFGGWWCRKTYSCSPCLQAKAGGSLALRNWPTRPLC